jgi:hypothetical protein
MGLEFGANLSAIGKRSRPLKAAFLDSLAARFATETDVNRKVRDEEEERPQRLARFLHENAQESAPTHAHKTGKEGQGGSLPARRYWQR